MPAIGNTDGVGEMMERDLEWLIDTVADFVNRSDLTRAKIGGFVWLAELDLRSMLPPICPPLPSLTASEPTNWLMSSRPDVYLAATLAEVFHWAHDMPSAATHWSRVITKVFGPWTPSDAAVEEVPETVGGEASAEAA